MVLSLVMAETAKKIFSAVDGKVSPICTLAPQIHPIQRPPPPPIPTQLKSTPSKTSPTVHTTTISTPPIPRQLLQIFESFAQTFAGNSYDEVNCHCKAGNVFSELFEICTNADICFAKVLDIRNEKVKRYKCQV